MNTPPDPRPEPVYECRAATSGLTGTLAVPGDKSISHRALMFGCLASGPTTIRGLLKAQDVQATAAAMTALGGGITQDGDLTLVAGRESHSLQSPPNALDLGNSGTGIRLLAGLLVGQGLSATLTGDGSLTSRPMGRILRPLAAMGARVSAADGDQAPFSVAPGEVLNGLQYAMPVASAQLKSCLLLAGLGARGSTRLLEPAPSRDHTETMLKAYGVALGAETIEGQQWLVMPGQQQLRGPMEIEVPGDFSSAAFFLVAASLVPDSDVLLTNVGLNPVRCGLLDLLWQMGANIMVQNQRQSGGELVADLRVQYAPLKGVEVDPALVPLMIDEFPVLFVAAALSEGTTRVTGAAELRVKESDRLAVMARGLQALGVAVEEFPDGLEITGTDSLSGGRVHARHDHRCAMSFAVAAMRASGTVTVESVANVATSFPGFRGAMVDLGAHIDER